MSAHKKTLAFRRLLIAHATFQKVASGCRALRSFALKEDADFYAPFFAGICVTYIRPFRRADGLGLLPQFFSTFPPGSPHAQTHKDLEDGRDGAFAHYTPEQAAKLLPDVVRQDIQKKIQILVRGGEFGYRAPAVTWARDRLQTIDALALFQAERARAEAAKLFAHLAEGKKFPDGDYVLDETFP